MFSFLKGNSNEKYFARESQVEGIEMLVRLSRHHPDMLLGSLRSINMSLMKQAKNLRSQVSRAAIQAFTYFFDHLKRNMEAVSVLSLFF